MRREPRERIALWLCLGFVVAVALYPFDFYPRNRVEWLEERPGLYFGGQGISYTPDSLTESPGTWRELTLEVWLHERKTSKNWGPRVILSLDPSPYAPPIMLGQQGGRLFLYSLDPRQRTHWYEQFIIQEQLVRGQDHFVAIRFGRGRKTVSLDDRVVASRLLLGREKRFLALSGRLILGNTLSGRHAWWGEVLGVAIYRRAVVDAEIERHRELAEKLGVASLITQPDLVGLYSFEEASGNTVNNLVDGPDLEVPNRFSALPQALLYLPSGLLSSIGMRRDTIQNLLLFLPLGWIMTLIALRHVERRKWALVASVVLAGAFLSFGLEVTQLLLPSRTSSLSDILMNTLGTALGAGAALLTRGRPSTSY